MAKWYVTYSGGMEVEADSYEEAIEVASEELLDLEMNAELVEEL